MDETWFDLSLVQQMVKLISKEVLEDYFGEHNLDCTGEQINRYYQAYQYLL